MGGLLILGKSKRIDLRGKKYYCIRESLIKHNEPPIINVKILSIQNTMVTGKGLHVSLFCTQ